MQLSDRIAEVRQLMEREGVDALVVVSNGAHSIDFNNPLFHISGFRELGPSLFVLRADGAPTLIVSPAHDVERASRNSQSFFPGCVGCRRSDQLNFHLILKV